MASTTDISICIVNYNVSGYLRRCLESIDKNRNQLKLEVIVVDNASKDDSVQMVKESFAWVRLIALDRNAGFAAANNIALKESSGEYLFLLNPDTVICKDSLVILMNSLKDNPGCGIAGPKLLNEDGSIQNGIRRFPDPLVVFIRNTPLKHLNFCRLMIDDHHMRKIDLSRSMTVDQVSGAAMMFHRKILEQTGFLDERFFIFFEEVDFCKRINQQGLTVFYNTNAAIYHFGGKSSVQLNSKIKYIHMESQLKFLKKYMPKLNYMLFIFMFKSIYLSTLILETAFDCLVIPVFKFASSIKPSLKNGRKFKNRHDNFHYRCYILKNRFLDFIRL